MIRLSEGFRFSRSVTTGLRRGVGRCVRRARPGRAPGPPALDQRGLRWRVTSEKLCRAQQELHFQAATYLCLLRSVREHEALHREYHGRGERSPQEVAGLVGFRLPQQPGGKG
ncbi:protein FMC1 homolog isoform X1 [Cinclus cinclus]|uniref:protein FMC1 homolog isoform X1 n=1 Tax=Cinclus cinclus TaxID=127875 RepID=UPI002E13C972